MSPYYFRKRLGRAVKRLLGMPTFPPKRYEPLYADIARSRSVRILEVGTNDGVNAVEMARAAKRGGVSEIDYYGFDLFEALDAKELSREFSIRTRSKREVAKYLHQRGVEKVQLIAGDTRSTLPEAAQKLGKMDFIFIDGGHSYETVLSDWNSVEPMIADDTIVYFDDYANFGIGKVVDAIDRSKWHVDILPHADRFRIADKTFGSADSPDVLEVRVARVRRRS